ncbi:radical SAM family heme chaperone HemW [Aerococcus sanguinicola]|uniref:radical SAM family heme chaperone HemW n=1 Tax=unclassified Aerococcus TaxID=2618060 RepID=UPI0008A21FA2|nr:MULTISPECIES: radical SAM family heme chaperone HemW [unclassified Aerococcus]MDK6232701.1 radical SAM family heme chaperone HemW [Aerococcus sp. UMB10185]MDK6855009.1 radical SAM family heme chaperone HemW [Aerococcus sp. UMB7533]MDK8501725.1 radical SAM family heme chaperone HemW [Aerococcus sp. UMB1112A]OFN02766.1 coproporphyrinogen III oxidase [Aerococcus sp. HMSC062A02]OHO45565.1 coproporphyrinogen III oxidase [Aerococcus sp. HMSC035B07]
MSLAQSIYIHIPFCNHICYYCDFNKVFIENQPVDDYISALGREYRAFAQELGQEKIETIYVGGGTPSSLNEAQIADVFQSLYPLIDLSPEAEISFEINPNDITADKLAMLKAQGVNRLSIGVQTFNNELLRKIGRKHTAEEAVAGIRLAQEMGFDNLSMDLIFALPKQTLADFEDSLHQALKLDLPHYSIYSLILEKKTVFYNLMRQGKLPLPSQDLEAEMFQVAIDAMEGAGRRHYEISNYGLPGYESRHNLAYWDNAEYFGFGAGAHGYLKGWRYQNHGPIQHYLEAVADRGHAILRKQELSLEQRIEEEMFLGLREAGGVSRARFKADFGIDLYDLYQDAIDQLLDQGLIIFDEDHIALSHHGLFLGNEVFQTFLLSDETD